VGLGVGVRAISGRLAEGEGRLSRLHQVQGSKCGECSSGGVGEGELECELSGAGPWCHGSCILLASHASFPSLPSASH
jgi:hypothetical protein